MKDLSKNEIAFWVALKQLLKTPEWHRKEGVFAAELGVSGAYLSEIKNGKKRPSPQIKEKIAQIAGYDSPYQLETLGHDLLESDSTQIIKSDAWQGKITNEEKALLKTIRKMEHKQDMLRIINSLADIDKKDPIQANRIFTAIYDELEKYKAGKGGKEPVQRGVETLDDTGS